MPALIEDRARHEPFPVRRHLRVVPCHIRGGRRAARRELETLSGNRRVLAQATWRHLLFGIVLGELERRLNPADEFEPPPEVPVSSNGHGNIEHAAAAAS